MTDRAYAILEAGTRGFVATRTAAGGAVVHPISVFHREGALWMNTYLKSAKARNMIRHPAVAVVVVGSGDGAPRPPGVLVRGRAELLPEDADPPPARVEPAYLLPGVTAPVPGDPIWSLDGRRRWFRVPLADVTLLEDPDAQA
ncbi:pyridoxamine 5'-phosphate oxidase family protein [Pseudonocardia sp. N23]|uniref:pyridoxamine 5'-phosphate oxidase family protein n=1 Tax=Pseudonocardia sp. N23 TaxID=1987376 RepID=UPI000C0275FE|nr:pyridoxamine 5'-phosphate oxidase family protein [Pseudonocardia sp. N23]GAY07613.1 hypothetical protein TOK_3633 [Pseudonocardia sp. N23]